MLFPRTRVPQYTGKTRAGLTSGFEVGPGDHRYCGRQNHQHERDWRSELCIIGCVSFCVSWISLWIATTIPRNCFGGWAVSESGLSASLPWRVRPSSINPIFYGSPIVVSCSGCFSGLDAFSPYNLARGCPATPCRTTGRLAAPLPCSSRTKSNFPSDHSHP